VIIDDLNVLGAIRRPSETDPVLIVDPNAMLSLAVTLQDLEPIPWRDPEIS